MNPPANWYPDPTGRHAQRYWDGEQWTEHVFTDGVQAVDPLEAGAGATSDTAAGEVEESPLVGESAASATPDQADGWTPDDAPAATDDGSVPPEHDTATPTDEQTVAVDPVAHEVEADDVVAAVDEVTREAPAPVAGMPAPTAAARSEGPVTAASLGITGDLVGGAFAEREDQGAVSLQNSRLLRCRVGPGAGVVSRQGTMVAYQGDVSFDRQGAGGVGRALKRAATGEGLAMMRVEGSGDVFFADGAQHAFVLHLDGGPGISVNGRNVLAFDSQLAWDIERVRGASLLAGGLFNTTFTGTGWVALVSDGEPVVLRTDEAPTYVDVNALVAWSGGLSTRIVNTVTAKSLVGLGSGEAFQMAFDGAGIVIVQPSEGPTGGAAAAT